MTNIGSLKSLTYPKIRATPMYTITNLKSATHKDVIQMLEFIIAVVSCETYSLSP